MADATPVKIPLPTGWKVVIALLAAGLAVLGAIEFERHRDPAPPPAPTPIAIKVLGTPAPESLVRLQLAGAVDDADWEILYAPDITRAVDHDEVDAAGTRADFAGPAGAYRVTAWYTAAGKAGHATAAVSVGAPPPQPGPTPAPGPTPTPTPGPADTLKPPFVAIGVFDFSDGSQTQSPVWNSTAIAAEIRALGGTWLKANVGETNPDIVKTNWFAAAKKQGAPALVFASPTDVVYGSPAKLDVSDTQSVITAVKAAIGKR